MVKADEQGPDGDLDHRDLDEEEVGGDAAQPHNKTGAAELEDEASLHEVVAQVANPEGQTGAEQEEQQAGKYEGYVSGCGGCARHFNVLLHG